MTCESSPLKPCRYDRTALITISARAMKRIISVVAKSSHRFVGSFVRKHPLNPENGGGPNSYDRTSIFNRMTNGIRYAIIKTESPIPTSLCLCQTAQVLIHRTASEKKLSIAMQHVSTGNVTLHISGEAFTETWLMM